jgi:hypothetical protein
VPGPALLPAGAEASADRGVGSVAAAGLVASSKVVIARAIRVSRLVLDLHMNSVSPRPVRRPVPAPPWRYFSARSAAKSRLAARLGRE